MSNVKGITIELNADTSSFNKALKGIESESKKLQSELKSVNAALKLDPKNADLIKQKQELLTKAIIESKNAVNALKAAKDKADADMANGADVNQTQYRKLQREIAFAENNLKSLTKQANDFSGLSSKIAKVGDGFTSTGSKISAVGDKVKTLSTVSAGLLTALGGMAVKAAIAADDINTMAKVTGLSTDEIQKFQYASDRIDVSIDVLTGSMSKLVKNMATATKGTGDAYSAFKTLDVEFQNQDGSLRDKQAVFSDVISALGKMENSTQRDALAMQLMGKSAQELNPLILGGADDLKKYGEEAEKAGLILSQDTLNGANELADSIDKIKATVTASMGKVGSELADNLIPIIENGTEAIVEITDAFSKMSDGQQKFLVGALALGSVASPLLKTVGGISNGLGSVIGYGSKVVGTLTAGTAATTGATAATTALGAAMSALPIAAAVVGIGAAVAATIAMTAAYDDGTEATKRYKDEIESVKKSAEENIKNVEAENQILKEKGKRYEELRQKLNKTAAEEKELKQLAQDLNSVLPAGTSLINEQTGAYNSLGAALDDVIDKRATEAKVAANTEIYKGIVAQNTELQKSVDDYVKKRNESLLDKKPSGIFGAMDAIEAGNEQRQYQENLKQIEANKEQIKQLDDDLANLAKDSAYANMSADDRAKAILGISPKEVEKTGEELSKTFDELLNDIEREHSRGNMSEEQYYSQKYALLQKYNKLELEEKDTFVGQWNAFQEKKNKEYLDGEEKTAKEAAEVWQDSFEQISSDYETQAKEIENQAKAFSDRLANAELFSRETVGEDDNVLIQTNFKQKTEELEQYEQLLAQIRQNGAGNALTDEIQNLGVKDAIDYMQSLLKSDNIKQTMTDMEAYYAKANEIAKAEFSDESAALQEDVKSKITAIMIDMPDTARQQGYNTATAFLEGLSNGLGNSNTALIKTASNAINSPTQQAQQSSGLGATIIPQAGTTNLTVQLTLDGKVISETVIKNINQQSYNQGKSVIK